MELCVGITLSDLLELVKEIKSEEGMRLVIYCTFRSYT